MVLPRASDSSQTERLNERAMKRPICCQPPPSIQSIHANDLCMRMKPPPTLLTHNFRNFRIAFPHLAFISQPSCQCAIAHASFRSSMNARIENAPHPQILNGLDREVLDREVSRLHKISNPSDFRMRRSLEGCVSPLSAAVRCLLWTCPLGFFGWIKTRHAPHHLTDCYLIYFGVSRGAWPEACRLPCGVPNETNPSWHASLVLPQ